MEFFLHIIGVTVVTLICTFSMITLVTLFRMRWRSEKDLSCFVCARPRHWLLGHLYLGKDPEKILPLLCDICSEINDASQCWIGPFHCYLGMASNDSMKAILSTAEPKDEYSTSFVHPWIGDGLLLSSGKKWARNRRLLTKAFHFETLKPYAKLFNDSTKSLIDTWKKTCREKGGLNSIDIYKDISMFTLDSLLKCIFSIESNCQNHESHHPYLKGVSTLSDIVMERLLYLPYHLNAIFHLSPSGWRWRRACKQVHTFAANVIRERRQTLKMKASRRSCLSSGDQRGDAEDDEEDRQQVDFLDMLIMAKDENGNGFSDKEIEDEVNTFMFAGHDTTASTISWMLYTMATHPEYQQKCRKEINHLLESRKFDEIEWDDLSNMPFLTMCLKESMRLNTPVPTITRRIQQPLIFPDGRTAPAGTFITIPLYGYHHNEKNWKDANVFKPERFSQDNSQDRPPFMFIPFSAGPRNCIGQHFAMQEMKVVLALLLRHFSFSIDETAPRVVKIHSIVLRALNGIHLKIKANDISS